MLALPAPEYPARIVEAEVVRAETRHEPEQDIVTRARSRLERLRGIN
jgi:hypothetical protein